MEHRRGLKNVVFPQIFIGESLPVIKSIRATPKNLERMYNEILLM